MNFCTLLLWIRWKFTSHKSQCRFVCRRVYTLIAPRTLCRTAPRMSANNFTSFTFSNSKFDPVFVGMFHISYNQEFWFGSYIIGNLMTMLLRGFCKISTFAHILSHTGRPIGGMEHCWSRGHFDKCLWQRRRIWHKKNEQKNKLRNRCKAELSKLHAIIACWWWTEALPREEQWFGQIRRVHN